MTGGRCSLDWRWISRRVNQVQFKPGVGRLRINRMITKSLHQKRKFFSSPLPTEKLTTSDALSVRITDYVIVLNAPSLRAACQALTTCYWATCINAFLFIPGCALLAETHEESDSRLEFTRLSTNLGVPSHHMLADRTPPPVSTLTRRSI
jgi:hypothetical protein